MEQTEQTLLGHLNELRSRLFRITLAVIVFSGLMYAWHDALLKWLSDPLGLPLYYLSPAGGFLLAINVSLLFGCILAIPVIAWQLVRFLAPAVPDMTKSRSLGFIFWSVLLGACGAGFAYYLTMPAALNFLNSYSASGVEPLITAEEYVRFAMLYLAGFALIFQLPLVVWIINKFTPLQPSSMFRAQRWVIVSCFILAAILTPTPDPFNQLFMALPPIILYYLSILLVKMTIHEPREKSNQTNYLEYLDVRAIEPVKIRVSSFDAPQRVRVRIVRPKPVYWDIITA